MINLRSNYFDMDNWVIMDMKNIHMYDDDETPLTIFKVKVGVVDAEEIHLNNTYTKRSFDIIRWISKGEFDRLRNGAGVIIW